MSDRPRPLLAIRLIGPTEIVNEQKAFLVSHYAKVFDPKQATVRSSTYSGSYTGEIRICLTVTRRERN